VDFSNPEYKKDKTKVWDAMSLCLKDWIKNHFERKCDFSVFNDEALVGKGQSFIVCDFDKLATLQRQLRQFSRCLQNSTFSYDGGQSVSFSFREIGGLMVPFGFDDYTDCYLLGDPDEECQRVFTDMMAFDRKIQIDYDGYLENRLRGQRLKEQIKATLVFALKEWTKHQLSGESPRQAFAISSADETTVCDDRDFILFKFSDITKIDIGLHQFFACLKHGVYFKLDGVRYILKPLEIEHLMHSFGVKDCSVYSVDEGQACFEECRGCLEEILREAPDLEFAFCGKIEENDEAED